MATLHAVGRRKRSPGLFLFFLFVAPAVRVLGFVTKELRLLLSQRVLVGTLVLGPFLILLAFGLTFQGQQPALSTVLVVPLDAPTKEWVNRYLQQPTAGFHVVRVTEDAASARADVLAGRASVAVEVPGDAVQTISAGQRAKLRVFSDSVDPNRRAWLAFSTYVFVSELNKRVLTEVASSSKVQPIPPDVAAAPFEADSVDLSRYQPSYVGFYAPGVLALLIQHLGVTLGALTLVRERLDGSVETFRVAPISAFEIVAGKTIAYGLVLLAIAAALLALERWGLGVPTLGPLEWLGATLVGLTLASLGLGFAISALARTELQAVQMAMLALLTAVFFSGFLVSLDTFHPAARVISDVLPVSHGVQALQQLMLRGEAPQLGSLIALGTIAVLSFGVALIRFGKQLRLD